MATRDTMAGKLNGQRCYLAGPIDHAEDDGIGWRSEMTEWLSERGVMALDPTNKRTSNTIFNEIQYNPSRQGPSN